MVTLVPSQCGQMLKLVFAEWIHLAFLRRLSKLHNWWIYRNVLPYVSHQQSAVECNVQQCFPMNQRSLSQVITPFLGHIIRCKIGWQRTLLRQKVCSVQTMNLLILVLKLKCLSRTHSESFSYSVSAQGWVKCFSICDHYAKHSPSFFPS